MSDSEFLSTGEIHDLTGLGRWQAQRRIARQECDAVEAAAKAAYAADWRKREQIAKQRATALQRQRSSKRRAAERQRAPVWADRAQIQAVYIEAERLTIETGIPHHVDHIYPLCGKLVSGLHVHQNLQALPAVENMRKHNRFEVQP